MVEGRPSYTTDRFEYAWRWFELSARQRVTMFYFFLVTSGILANAYAVLIREELFSLATTLGVFGALIGGAFIVLDKRNLELVQQGRNMLKVIEVELEWAGTGVQNPLGPLTLEEKTPRPWYVKHWFLLRATESLAAASFAGGAVFAGVQWVTSQGRCCS